jgi:hypothetical protein
MDNRPWTTGSWATVHGQWSEMMESIARYLMIGGILLFLIGGGVYLAVKFGLPLGRLPGNIRIEGENGSFYFPLTTSILVSVVLTILLNFISRFLHK